MLHLNIIEVYTTYLKHSYLILTSLLMFLLKLETRKTKKRYLKIILSKTINLFQSFSSFHYFILIFLSNLNNFNIVLFDFIDLIKSNLTYQSYSDFQDNTIFTLFVYISTAENISHNKSHINNLI